MCGGNTGNIGHTTHRMKINKNIKQKNTTQKTEKMSNVDRECEISRDGMSQTESVRYRPHDLLSLIPDHKSIIQGFQVIL